jgi:hypothetical protein
MSNRTRAVVGVLALGVAVAGLAAALESLDPAASMATEEPERLVWSGQIRAELGGLPVQLVRDEQVGMGFRWPDRRDTPIGMVDIASVGTDFPDQPHWRIELAARPPRAAGLDPADTLISDGFVFETTGDGVGDFVVGINNDAPRPGELRVWVTDVASGATEEQIGPPYGFPIEFSYPGEPAGDPAQPVEVVFTFLGGSAPPGLTGASPFYAWASVTAGEEVVAWDYAPDASWLSAPAAGG